MDKVIVTVVAFEGYVAGATADPPAWSRLSFESIFTVVSLGLGEGQGISVAGNLVPPETVYPPKRLFTSPICKG